jgi:hypothetical protein
VKFFKEVFYKVFKDVIKEQRAVKIKCACGKDYTYHNKSRHYSSKFHINNI